MDQDPSPPPGDGKPRPLSSPDVQVLRAQQQQMLQRAQQSATNPQQQQQIQNLRQQVQMQVQMQQQIQAAPGQQWRNVAVHPPQIPAQQPFLSAFRPQVPVPPPPQFFHGPQIQHPQGRFSYVQPQAVQSGLGQGPFQSLPGSPSHIFPPLVGNPNLAQPPSPGLFQQFPQNNPVIPEIPTAEAESASEPRPFKECRISLAVDISGSTAGRVLSSEKEFMLKVVSQLSPANMAQNVRVLPWNHSADHPVHIQNLALQPWGGTDPVVLLESRLHLAILKRTNPWFLLTDGEIPSQGVNTFATSLAQKSMHGVPCVIVIFDSKSHNPSRCNISVGISPFAAVPHSALLYQDITVGGKCYVLATKGCFNALLSEGIEQPILDDFTTWDSLPTISPESAFRELMIPPARTLGESELALSDDLTINFDNLFNTDLNNDQVNQLLGNQDHLQSILLSAQSRGRSASALSWLQRQTAIPSPNPAPSLPGATPVDPVAASSIRRITDALQNRQSIVSPEFSALQSQIRESHRRNSRYNTRVNTRAEIITQAIDSHQQTSLSNWSSSSVSSVRRAQQQQQQLAPAPQYTPPPTTPSPDTFHGDCPICFESNSTLTILFKRPHNHPPIPPSPRTLTYPLAVGSSPEYDIISAWIVCENCSIYIIAQGETPFREPATSTLPLISWSSTSQRWRDSLAKAIDYFDAQSQPLLPILFLSILDHHLRTKAWCALDGSAENLQRRDALTWLRSTILKDVKMSGDGVKDTLGCWIKSIVTAPKGEQGLIWKYPIDGFVLMVSIARELGADQEVLTKVVWKKLLHHVTGRYVSELGQSDKARMGAKVDGMVGLMGREGWIEELTNGRFRPLARGEMEGLRKCKDEIMWIEAVGGPAMGKWLGFLKEVGPGKSTVEYVWEIKGRWGAEAECVFERPEDVVGAGESRDVVME